MRLPWPGNVRELQRVIERAVTLADSDQLRLDDLPPSLLNGYTEILLPSFRRQDSMRAWGSRYARMVLERCENNKRRACRELGISYHTLHGISVSGRRSAGARRLPLTRVTAMAYIPIKQTPSRMAASA